MKTLLSITILFDLGLIIAVQISCKKRCQVCETYWSKQYQTPRKGTFENCSTVNFEGLVRIDSVEQSMTQYYNCSNFN